MAIFASSINVSFEATSIHMLQNAVAKDSYSTFLKYVNLLNNQDKKIIITDLIK